MVIYSVTLSFCIGSLLPVVPVQVLLITIFAEEALLAEVAHHGLLLHMHLHMALQVCHHTEGFAALWAAMTPHLRVNL